MDSEQKNARGGHGFDIDDRLKRLSAKSKIRSRVEHVFAEQKDRMGLFIRTIGIARATTKVGLANLVYNHQAPAGRPVTTNIPTVYVMPPIKTQRTRTFRPFQPLRC